MKLLRKSCQSFGHFDAQRETGMGCGIVCSVSLVQYGNVLATLSLLLLSLTRLRIGNWFKIFSPEVTKKCVLVGENEIAIPFSQLLLPYLQAVCA